MDKNEDENVKVIQFSNKDNKEAEMQKNSKNDLKTDNDNPSKKKKSTKLKVQRTKAPKVYLKEQKKNKKGIGALFSCCLPSNKDDDDEDED